MTEEQTQETSIKQPIDLTDPKLSELFEYFMEPGTVRVVPMTVKEDEVDTRLLLLVQGDKQTASFIFSELWERVAELSQLEEQALAQKNEPSIITR
jgi:hypothetical protein